MFPGLRCFSVPALLLAVSSFQTQAQARDAEATVAATSAAPYDHETNRNLDAMKEAKQLERQKRAQFAADSNKIAGGQCSECFDGLYQVQMMVGDYKGAVATTVALETRASSPRKSRCGLPARNSVAIQGRGEAKARAIGKGACGLPTIAGG